MEIRKDIIKSGVIILGISLINFIVACSDQDIVYDEFKTLEGNSWSMYDTLHFEYEVPSKETLHDVYFQIRTTTEYQYSNLFFFMKITKPDASIQIDTFQMILAEPNGKWVGNNSGTFVESKFLIADNIEFPQEGVFTFDIIQGMDTENLKEVSDVGIRIEEVLD